VDLPDAVGHPVFPTTMEALIASSRGTVMDAARDALERDDALEFVVRAPRLLVPLLPKCIRTVRPPTPARGRRDPMAWYGMPGYHDRDAGSPAGPDEAVPGPGDGVEVWLACVAAGGGRDLSPHEAERAVFGYTVMAGSSRPEWTSLGPCVVTADEIDPAGLVLTARVGEEVQAETSLDDVPWGFPELLAHLSWKQEIDPGTILGAAGVRMNGAAEPGSTIEVEAAGVGVLRNHIGPFVA
jgi:hypothetical protein